MQTNHKACDIWHKFSVTTSCEHADTLAYMLMENGAEGTESTDSTHLNPPSDLKKSRLILSAYFSDQLHANQAARALASFVKNLKTQFPAFIYENPRITDVPNRDWNEQWKEHFHAFRIGRFFIYPDWSTPPEGENHLVCIRPAMAFGTGHHPTTRLCLAVMDRLLPTESFLDIGCGSAILAIAAARTGVGAIHAADCDPEAIHSAHENLILNRLENNISLEHAYAEDLKGRYTMVVANILSAILVQSAVQIASLVKPEGTLLLSGLLTEEVESVCQIYQQQRLLPMKVEVEKEWALIHMQKTRQ